MLISLNRIFKFITATCNLYNIDESHGLSHSMDILTCANKIYNVELLKQPYIKHHEKIIYVSSILHDMCDKKYMDQEKGIEDINQFMGSLKDDRDISIITNPEKEVINKIISTNRAYQP